jgi:hypothetical protein
MLNQLAGYFHNLFNNFGKPQTYGSALEEYIVSHSPQTACDIDRLIRQFHISQERNHGKLWF